jgi:hypothetical protein
MAITNKMVLPFTVKNNVEISGGYITELHSDFSPETLIADYHLENLYFDETVPHFAPLQSPFINRWVGGLPYRYIEFNTGSDSS